MSRGWLLLVCLLTGLVTTSRASLSILMVEPLMSTSHHVWTMTLTKGLLQQGHHVHVASIHEPNIKGDLAQNLTYAVFEGLMEEIDNTDAYNFIEWVDFSAFYSAYFMYQWGTASCDILSKTKGAQELLEIVKHHKFDVIVQDIGLFHCLFGLWEVAKGKPPVVGYMPFSPAPWINVYYNGPHYPTVRSYVYTGIARPKTIWQRTMSVVYYFIDDIMRRYHYLPISQRLAEQFVGQKIRPIQEIEENIDIVLLNTHPTFDNAIPLPPNVIEIGGMHAQNQKSAAATVKYPEGMQKFLDEAENGFIVISLGTNVKWKHVGMEKVNAVIAALAKLKLRILWKLDMSITTSDNVMAAKWIPQNDVLNHKNIKAIWTHGGLLSMQEAIWKGVPLVATPFCFDQKYNVDFLIAKGAGINFNFQTMSTQSVLNTLEEIVYNKSYLENMKKWSKEFRDRALPPLDLAIWSIEYAVRNPNGTLATPLRNQSCIERNLIDIYAILILSLVVLLSLGCFVTKMIYRGIRNNVAFKARKDKQM